MSTLREALKQAENRLKAADVPDAVYDAWELLEYVLKIEKSYYFLHENDRMEDGQRELFERLVKQREKRIPLQQITGSAWFMGYEFYVNSNVLTPRFDTEILVEETGKLLKSGMKILDMCTGSGCILLSLLAGNKELRLTGTGVDVSSKALEVAEINRKRLEVEAELKESDLFSNVVGTYDIIVSNPPYIATKELAGLMPEVKDHEPILALDGREDGLYFYKKIVEQAGKYLNPSGWLCFEIGYDQGEALSALLKNAGYEKIRICKDLAGLPRVALGQKLER